MDNPNPIYYSDLIKPDSSITDLISQLKELIAQYDSAKSKIQGTAQEMARGMQNVSAATEEQRAEISRMSVESDKLAAQYSKVTNAETATQRALLTLKQAEKDKTAIDKLVIQLATSQEGSYNRLSAQYRLNKIRLNEMSEAQRHGTESGRKLEAETKAIYERMSELQKQTGKYTLEVGHYENAMKALPGPLRSVTQGFGQMSGQLKSIGHSDLPLGAKALQGFSTVAFGVIGIVSSLVTYLTSAAKTMREFEQANANLSTILGVNIKDMTAMSESALSLGRSTEYTAAQVTALQTELAKLGFKQGSILSMQKSVLQFATAVGANLAEAAAVAGSTLRAFNLTSADTEDALATLAVATNNSALSFARIQDSIGTVFPVANAYGLTLKDTTALLGALANAGFDASSAATATRNILLNLADSNGKLAQRLGGSVSTFDDIIERLIQLRKSGVDVAEALELTDKRSVAAFSAFVAGAESAKELRDSLTDVSGELDRIQSERLNTVEGSTLLLKSAWEGLTLAFNKSNGAIKETIDWLTRLVTATQKLLFPDDTFKSESSDSYTEMFRNYYAKNGAEAAKSFINSFVERVGDVAEQTAKEASRAPILNKLLGLGTPAVAKGAALSLEAVKQSAKTVIEQIDNDVAESTRRAAIQAEQAAGRVKSAGRKSEDQIKAEEKARAKAEKERKKQADEEKKAREEAIKGEKALLQSQLQTINLQIAVTQEGTQEMLALRIAAINKQREVEIFENKNLKEELRQDEKAINAKYDAQVLKTEKDFYTQLAARDFEAQQDLDEANFALLQTTEAEKTRFRLQQEKERLERILELNETAANKMTDVEIAAVKATIAGIEKEEAKAGRGQKDFYDLVGLKWDDDQKEAMDTVVSQTLDNVSEIIDAWSEAADARVEAAQTSVDAAQSELDAEIEARNNGYANNVEQAQKNLQLQQAELEEAQKEKEKATKAQLALDTITQTASLITASANIWASLSKVGPAGPALAVAALATMWGSFAIAKVKAAQVASTGTETYGEGTVELLEGGSHASGHDIDMGRKKDGTRRRAEGGEFFAVINKRNSRRYRDVIPDVINAFNDGTFADKYEKASESMNGFAVSMLGGTDVSGLERDVRAIREQGTESRYVDARGNVVVRYKNLTKIVRN